MGVDPMLVLKASGADLAVITALLNKLVEISEQRDENQAVRIANAVGQVFGGKG